MNKPSIERDDWIVHDERRKHLPEIRLECRTCMREVIDKIDALHHSFMWKSDRVLECDECGQDWPCPTHLLIHPENQFATNESQISSKERIAKAFHDAYEALAPQFGYETRPASAVMWENVPPQNRYLMEATAQQLLNDGVIREGDQ